MTAPPLLLRRLPGLTPYETCWASMKQFTQQRSHDTPDEIWLLEHAPIYTLGQAGAAQHRLTHNAIELIRSDRGGEITYHGPGQCIIYPLISLKNRQLSTRDYVRACERLIIQVLARWHIEAHGRTDAPGVYVGKKKIASLGIRVSRYFTTHGIALNVNMDMTPFAAINPCGFDTLAMTQMADYIPNPCMHAVQDDIIDCAIGEFYDGNVTLIA